MIKVIVVAAATLAVAADVVSAGMPPEESGSAIRSVNEQRMESGERVEKWLGEESMTEDWQREGEDYLPLVNKDGALPRGPSASLQILAERLGLSHDQQNRIRQILNRKVILIRGAMRDATVTAVQRREKAASILEEEYGKIRKLLTPEQRKEFEEMKRAQGTGRKTQD